MNIIFKKKFYLFFKLTLLFLVCLSPAVSFAADSVILQLRWDNQFQFAGYYAAEWQGFYKEEGLEVSILPGVNSNGIVSATDEVKKGRAHFGIGGADILTARDAGSPLVLVASVFQHSAASFYTRKGQRIAGPSDFLKFKVARRVNDLIDIELQAMLIAEGIDPTKVKAYPHKPGMDHLISGEVDIMPGYSISTPFTAHTKKFVMSEFRPIKYGIDFYGDSLFTNQNLVDENPALVSRFKTASMKGWVYALNHPEEISKRIASELSRVKRVEDLYAFNLHQSKGVRRLIPYPEVEVGHINPLRWERMNEYLLTLDLVNGELDLDSFIFDPLTIEKRKSDSRQQVILWIMIVLLILLLAGALWSYSLRHTVKVKTKELESTNKKLLKSEIKYRELVEIAQEGIWAIDEDNNTKFVNPSMAEMLGYTVDEMSGKPLFSFMDEGGVAIAKENIERRKQGEKEDHDFRFMHKNGKNIYVAMVTAPIFNSEGIYKGAIAGVIDFTERRAVEKENKDLEMQLMQASKMESIGNLAGGIAHDFNNILSSIIGFTELALEESPKGSSQRDDLEEVHIAGNRAKDLVQQILAFARQSEEKTSPVRLSDIIAEVLKLLRPSTPTTIDIKSTIESTARVIGNSSQLHQIVMNLCTNAIHSLQNSGGNLEIELKNTMIESDSGRESSVLPGGEYIELNISDDGSGIDPTIIDNIFEPYFTTKGVGEGTGMGLAMVKGLVENYGGDIKVKSDPTEKTTFVIRLPVATGKSFEAIPEVEQVALGTERVLFVDDEPPIARMGSRMLEKLGYKVTTRTNSFEALELFKEKPEAFDLIITDMTMPSMTGDELSMEIKKIRRDIPVILCTGYSNKINDERAKLIGIDAFVYKPFTKSDFAETIRTVLSAY